MSMKKEVIVLKDKWNTSATDVPEPRSIEMTEVSPDIYMNQPLSVWIWKHKKDC